jgi:hypothetical protein
MSKSRVAIFLASVAASAVFVSSAMAGFGFSELDTTFTGPDGSPAMQAGSHPYAFSTTFGLNTVPEPIRGEIPDGGVAKDVIVSAPPGLVGDPTAVPRCSTADFLTVTEGSTNESLEDKIACPDSTALGVAFIRIALDQTPGTFEVPVYNLPPPPGAVAKFGFYASSVPVTVELRLNPNPPYNVIARATNISELAIFYGSELTLWGNPADPSHDTQRGDCLITQVADSCPVSGSQAASSAAPFLRLPTSCTGPLITSFEADSWLTPGAWVEGKAETHDNSEPHNPLGTIGCEKLGFGPTIAAKPTTEAAESPTGLDFSLDVNNEGLTSSTGLADSDIKKVVVALPEGMSVNPALAEGLGACSEADLAREAVNSAPGEGCPEESKIGTVEVETPLLEQTLKGSLFLARQNENPFHSLLALYVVIKNPETGIMLRLPGKVEPNPATGQIVSVFDDLPQLPFSHFRLSFRQGQRSPLVTPPACGTYTTQAELTPWSNPNAVLHDASTFRVTTGVGGGACPSGGSPPFAPGLLAGTLNNAAGAYAPLDIRITRSDGEQEITGFASQLPPGLTANLTGVPFCPEAQISAARSKTGAQEETEASCPQASEIGHTLVGVGVGSVLAYTPGRLYMAGPFEGAPFSVVAITSAKVGPFDLGTVVVHLPLQIDPITASVSIPAGAADQIPHIIDGIVVHVRDIRVYADRPNFIQNPTNCSPLSFVANVAGSGQSFTNPADDISFAVDDPFQVAGCAGLAFKPGFKASVTGKTSKANGAGLNVKLSYPNAPHGTQTNIHSVKVELPKQLPSRLTTLQKACTAAQFRANPAGCPAASVVGHARAITPILPLPLEGPAYFVSNGGEAFPNLIMVLQGYGVTIDLVGSTFISKAGITSSTFKTVPDQPVSSFELVLPQGPYSALTANGDLCSGKLTMPTEFIAQNGAVVRQATRVGITGCPKAKAPTRAQKLAKALKACHRKSKGVKRTACERQARKKYGPGKAKKKKRQQ